MDVGTFCAQSHVLVVAGKGGVGKTTMSAALAKMAAGAGKSVLIVELEGKSGITGAFGGREDLGYEEMLLAPARPGGAGRMTGSVRARRLTPDDALMEYLEQHGLRRVSKRLAHSGVLDVVSTAIPGIRDVLVLGKVKQLEREAVADLIVVDAPATGHAITFLTSASGLVNAARGGPLRTQAQDVVDLLSDPARCRVILVTLPEELPVSETIESAYTLEDKAGVQLGPVIVNACDPEPAGLARPAPEVASAAGATLEPGHLAALEEARRFRLARHAVSAEQVERLRRDLPLPQLLVPALETEHIGAAETERLAEALADSVTRAGGRRRRMSSTAAADGSAGGGYRSGRCGNEPRLSWDPKTGDAAGAGRRALGHRVLRVGGRRQDDRVRHLRPGGGPRRPTVLRGHRRPGPAPGRRARSGIVAQHADRGGGDWPGHLHALMLDSKGTFDDLIQRYARTTGAGGVDPGQPALPEPRRRAVGHAGVHGHGEALRAGALQ